MPKSKQESPYNLGRLGRFRLAELAQDMEARAHGQRVTPSDIRGQLDFLFNGLDLTLQDIDLTEREALLICDALNGTLHEPHTVTLLWAGIADAISEEGLDTKWTIDGAALIRKLRHLDYWQSLAIIDAVHRAWKLLLTTSDRHSVLITVGLLREARKALQP